MVDQVPDEVKAERNRLVLEAAGRVAAARSRRLEGRTLPVLVDGVSRKSVDEVAGRTRCNRVVNFAAAGRDLLGQVVAVRIARALPHSLRGELVEDRAGASCAEDETVPALQA
jgi:tRNA-2-methylthio-N6-dimethylallyladenosine synthase